MPPIVPCLTPWLCCLVGRDSCRPRPLGSVCHTSQTCSAALTADCVLTRCSVHSATTTDMWHNVRSWYQVCLKNTSMPHWLATCLDCTVCHGNASVDYRDSWRQRTGRNWSQAILCHKGLLSGTALSTWSTQFNASVNKEVTVNIGDWWREVQTTNISTTDDELSKPTSNMNEPDQRRRLHRAAAV